MPENLLGARGSINAAIVLAAGSVGMAASFRPGGNGTLVVKPRRRNAEWKGWRRTKRRQRGGRRGKR